LVLDHLYPLVFGAGSADLTGFSCASLATLRGPRKALPADVGGAFIVPPSSADRATVARQVQPQRRDENR
jgi:hypothetical protein